MSPGRFCSAVYLTRASSLQFSEHEVPPISVCEAYISACAAQAYLEKAHGTGDKDDWKERAFGMFEKLKDAHTMEGMVWESQLSDRVSIR